jgi:hypothetical protein
MEPDRLFCHTLDDLAARAVSEDEYDVLFSAALVRKLLMDEEPLMHRVNRTYRLAIRFTFNGPTRYEEVVLSRGPWFWSIEDGLDPRTGGPPGLINTVEGKLDDLLGRRVMRVRGHDVSVRDLVAQLAHIEGGVHVARAKTEKERALLEAAKTLFVGNLPAGIRMMRSIDRVVLLALAPLREAIVSP